jgi:DNA invertase Pin-like site-specific DNA recombinase
MEAITSGINRYMMRLAEQQVKLAFAQANKEVMDLRQRTKEGIETARLNNKQIGGVVGKKLNVKKAQPAKELIRKHSKTFGGTLTDIECMKLIGIANNTYYKYKKELMEGE